MLDLEPGSVGATIVPRSITPFMRKGVKRVTSGRIKEGKRAEDEERKREGLGGREE